MLTVTASFGAVALVQALSATWSNTIAGAVAPIITALLFIPVRMLYRRVEKVLDQAKKNHDLTADEVGSLKKELAEAKAAIRGDLANGVKATLDRVETKVEQLPQKLTTEPEPPREV
jgi:uncharacterized protein YoxC